MTPRKTQNNGSKGAVPTSRQSSDIPIAKMGGCLINPRIYIYIYIYINLLNINSCCFSWPEILLLMARQCMVLQGNNYNVQYCKVIMAMYGAIR